MNTIFIRQETSLKYILPAARQNTLRKWESKNVANSDIKLLKENLGDHLKFSRTVMSKEQDLSCLGGKFL